MRLALLLMACGAAAFAMGRKPAEAPVQPAAPVHASPFGENLERIHKDVARGVRSIEALLKEGDLDDDERLHAMQALGHARAARERTRRALSAFAQGERLERRVEQARFFKRVMESYLTDRGPYGYGLRQDTVLVDGTELDSLEEIESRLPFLKGLRRGRVLITPGAQAALQFDALRREYYQALFEASRINPEDKRVLGLASWGRNTEVVYPNVQGLDRLAVIAEEDYRRISAPSETAN